ncbi:MAG: alpha/beta hydrolase [Edaphobacter sp.]
MRRNKDADKKSELHKGIGCGAILCAALFLSNFSAWSQQANAGPQSDSSVIDSQGTAHITRVIPVPQTVSPQAQRVIARPQSDAVKPETLETRRTGTDAWQARAGKLSESLYPVHVVNQTIAGVAVRVVTPLPSSTEHSDRVLINLHGGGFNSDSGSLTESVPIANLTQTKVISVLYRLAPEHPFPAAVDDAVAVYREVLKTYKPAKIAIYGTSAGAILTGEVAVKLKQLGLPLPGALGIFSGFGDFNHVGDSQAMYALAGLAGHLDPPGKTPIDTEYARNTNPEDPVLSPIYADLHGLPPTLFITSGRDMLLSGTTILHRAFLRNDVDAQLVVFEGLSHAFWNDAELPESKEAYGIMAKFFDRELGR